MTKADVVAVPRLAATLLVLRTKVACTEILMGRRSASHRFMPNSLVFPGGAVDDEDYAAAVASPLRGDVETLLLRSQDHSTSRALAVAAARELQEETGLSLGLPPRLDALDLLCRAITPSFRPKRFDAYFFVASADAVEGTIAGSPELDEVAYMPIDQVIAGEPEFATRGALDQLSAWLSAQATPASSRQTIPVMREKIWYDE